MPVMNQEKASVLHRQVLIRHPSLFLLVAQLLSLVLYAVFDGADSGKGLLAAFGVLVLLLVVWVVKRSPATNWIAWALATMAAVLWLLSWISVIPTLSVWASLLEAALYFYAAGSMIAYMMEDEEVTADELFAAGATFTLIAWAFAYLYLVCQAWFPGCFSAAASQEPQTFLKLLFLSFTNLSATGLSDIVPVTPPARVLVMLEQFAGIAYLAVVVSRLVGLMDASARIVYAALMDPLVKAGILKNTLSQDHGTGWTKRRTSPHTRPQAPLKRGCRHSHER